VNAAGVAAAGLGVISTTSVTIAGLDRAEGGGGYLLLFCDFRRRQEVAKAVTNAGGHIVDFAFCLEGAQSWAVRPKSSDGAN